MNQQFFHIAQVSFFHEYVENDLFDGFSVGWNVGTSRVLMNLKLLIKPFSGGFNILCSEPEILTDEANPVLIQLFLKDSLFYNYTDFGQSVKPNTHVFLFSQKNGQTNSGNLHDEEFTSHADTLEILNKNILKDISNKLVKGEISIHDQSKNHIDSEEFLRYFLQSEESLLEVGEEKNQTLYYKVGKGMEKIPFGIVSLNLGQLIGTYHNSETTVPLQVRFKSRKTRWKYILSDKVFEKFSRLSVVDIHDNEFLFKEGEFEIQPAWKVRSFESEKEIPFRAYSKSQFQLIEKSLDNIQSGKVIQKHLPEAKPEQLYQLQSNPEISYSHIFI